MSPSDTVEVNNKIEVFLNGCPGPIQGIIRPLLNPLLEAIDWVAGDPDDLIRAADVWEKAAGEVRSVLGDQTSNRQTLTGLWQGPASTQFGTKMDEIEKAIEAIAQNVQDTSGLLVEAAKGCVDTANLIIDLIIDLIMMLVADLLVSLALSVVSFGASMIAGAAKAGADAAMASTRVVRLMTKLAELLNKLASIMRKLADAAKTYKEVLKALKLLKKEAGLIKGVPWGVAKSVASMPVRAGLGAVIGESVPGGPAGGVFNMGKDVYNYATKDD
jgi:WXG100 family type VII secretion target